MAMEFTKILARQLNLKAGNATVETVVELSEKGIKFKRKGKRKTIEVSWEKLLSAPELFKPTEDCPALTLKEMGKIKENPLAFLLDA
jgi:hypothetical protein